MLTTWKKFLSCYRSGASIFEWTITLPFTLLTVFVALYMMLMILSWTSYCALASNLAKDLNTRSTGIIYANKWINENVPGRYIINGKNAVGSEFKINKDQFYVNGQNSYTGTNLTSAYWNTLLYHVHEYGDQFYFPYTTFKQARVYFKQVDASGVHATGFDSAHTLSNYIVKVDIDYDFALFKLNFVGGDLGKLNLKSTGYGIIT